MTSSKQNTPFASENHLRTVQFFLNSVPREGGRRFTMYSLSGVVIALDRPYSSSS